MENVNELLSKIEEQNKRVAKANREADTVKGQIKAKHEEIQRAVKQLATLGIDLEFSLDDKGNLSKDFVDSFSKVYKEVIVKKMQESEQLENLLNAVETQDYAKIKELTGEDVSKVNYDVDLSNLEELKREVKESADNILSGATIKQDEDVEEFSADDISPADIAKNLGVSIGGSEDLDDLEDFESEDDDNTGVEEDSDDEDLDIEDLDIEDLDVDDLDVDDSDDDDLDVDDDAPTTTDEADSDDDDFDFDGLDFNFD